MRHSPHCRAPDGPRRVRVANVGRQGKPWPDVGASREDGDSTWGRLSSFGRPRFFAPTGRSCACAGRFVSGNCQVHQLCAHERGCRLPLWLEVQPRFLWSKRLWTKEGRQTKQVTDEVSLIEFCFCVRRNRGVTQGHHPCESWIRGRKAPADAYLRRELLEGGQRLYLGEVRHHGVLCPRG